MSETRKTLITAGVAVVLMIIAVLVAPGRITPSAFQDQGEPFFPEFEDPNTATTLEIIDFDDATGAAVPFKVTFTNGRWTIPSHHDYPADAKDRLARTAAGIIDITKDEFRSDNVADQEVCGVVDPLDETAPGLEGRGQRVTIKDRNDNVLADIIIGRPVEDMAGFRFVRMPGQKRIYAAKTDVEITTAFQDWIDTDLLQVAGTGIDGVTILDYSINERTRKVDERDRLALYRKDKKWTARSLPAGRQVDSAGMAALIAAIDSLSIVGVRPKPAGLSRTLLQATGGKEMSREDVRSLQSKGFYFTQTGELKSNEGELVVKTAEGVIYTLRFGEVLYGSGLSVTAGTEEAGADQQGTSENRYLFITTQFDATPFPEPPQPTSTDFLGKADSLLTDAERAEKTRYDEHEAWKRDIDRGTLRSQQLNARFAEWYYVISSASFDKLNVTREDLIVSK